MNDLRDPLVVKRLFEKEESDRVSRSKTFDPYRKRPLRRLKGLHEYNLLKQKRWKFRRLIAAGRRARATVQDRKDYERRRAELDFAQRRANFDNMRNPRFVAALQRQHDQRKQKQKHDQLVNIVYKHNGGTALQHHMKRKIMRWYRKIRSRPDFKMKKPAYLRKTAYPRLVDKLYRGDITDAQYRVQSQLLRIPYGHNPYAESNSRNKIRRFVNSFADVKLPRYSTGPKVNPYAESNARRKTRAFVQSFRNIPVVPNETLLTNPNNQRRNAAASKIGAWFRKSRLPAKRRPTMDEIRKQTGNLLQKLPSREISTYNRFLQMRENTGLFNPEYKQKRTMDIGKIQPYIKKQKVEVSSFFKSRPQTKRLTIQPEFKLKTPGKPLNSSIAPRRKTLKPQKKLPVSVSKFFTKGKKT